MIIRDETQVSRAYRVFFFKPVSHYGVVASRSRGTVLGAILFDRKSCEAISQLY
jgi:hypothetical protein